MWSVTDGASKGSLSFLFALPRPSLCLFFRSRPCSSITISFRPLPYQLCATSCLTWAQPCLCSLTVAGAQIDKSQKRQFGECLARGSLV